MGILRRPIARGAPIYELRRLGQKTRTAMSNFRDGEDNFCDAPQQKTSIFELSVYLKQPFPNILAPTQDKSWRKFGFYGVHLTHCKLCGANVARQGVDERA